MAIRTAPTIHVVDHDYDTVIILKNPSSKFAGVENPVETSELANPRPPEWNEEGALLMESSSEIAQSEPEADLKLASPWFKRAMAEEGWMESKLQNGYHQLLAQDWDEQVFLMLLNIFHLRNKQVSRVISLEMLAKIAILVDYYECSEAIELFTDMWIDEVAKDAIPTTYCRDLVLWIWMSWVFGLADPLKIASSVAIKEGRGTMDTSELPIPTAVSSEIDLRRYQAIEALLDGLHTLLDKYRSSSYTCTQSNVLSFQCGSFMLGALTKELDGWMLFRRVQRYHFKTSASAACVSKSDR